MPCNSEYMEPTVKERQRIEAASLLSFVYGKLSIPAPKKLKEAVSHPYGGDDDSFIRELCSVLKSMSDWQKDHIVYDGRNATSRRLADWWDEHQKEDEKRIEIERRTNIDPR